MLDSSKYVPLSESNFSVGLMLSKINFFPYCPTFEDFFPKPNLAAICTASFTDKSTAGLNPLEPIGSLPN